MSMDETPVEMRSNCIGQESEINGYGCFTFSNSYPFKTRLRYRWDGDNFLSEFYEILARNKEGGSRAQVFHTTNQSPNFVGIVIKNRVKYILAPQTTTL
jgi:hypothetical protein